MTSVEPNLDVKSDDPPQPPSGAKAPTSGKPINDEDETDKMPKLRRLLVVDDDDDIAAFVAEILVREGYEVVRANNGEEGMRLAREQQPELILLDVCMPRLNGYDAAELLEEDPTTRDIPILFLSAADDLMTRVRSLRVTEMDFLAKPFNRKELLARVERALTQVEFHRRVRVEANLDELTGLSNLRSFRERLAVEQARWTRYGTPVSIAMIDVDKLKQINDQHGHAAGSRALSAIGAVLRKDIRETDLAVRYGGDEFVVLLPHATLLESTRFAERVLSHIRELRLDGMSPAVSIGVASSEGTDEDLEALLLRADAATYRAKRRGGDRVCVDEPGGSSDS